MIYMVQPSLGVSTWRTRWPGEELRRRGHAVIIDAMDAGYSPDEVPDADTTVVHLTPSVWAYDPWLAKVEEAIARADRLVIDVDDDWSKLLDIQETGWREGT